MVPEALPWYEFRRDMISWEPVYSLAIMMASSLASVPELVKKTTYHPSCTPQRYVTLYATNNNINAKIVVMRLQFVQFIMCVRACVP
jgi:hypothetical protein